MFRIPTLPPKLSAALTDVTVLSPLLPSGMDGAWREFIWKQIVDTEIHRVDNSMCNIGSHFSLNDWLSSALLLLLPGITNKIINNLLTLLHEYPCISHIVVQDGKFEHLYQTTTTIFNNFGGCPVRSSGWTQELSPNRPLAEHIKLRVVPAPGMPRTFYSSPRVSDPDMHHDPCVPYMP